MTIYRQGSVPSFRDITTSTGDAARVWPGKGNVFGTVGTAPVLLWHHPASANQGVNPSYFMYSLIHAAHNRGWVFAAANQHSSTADQWGSTTGLNDAVALDSYIRTNYSTGPRILVGGSMGGLTTALLIPDGRITGIKGCYTIDAVFSLAALYANATYTAPIKTAYGIAADGSDYAAKTAGHDPMLLASSAFGTTVSWRFVASSADTTVSKSANTDAFAALLGAVPEKAVVSKVGGHLSLDGARPRDLMAFVERCLAR